MREYKAEEYIMSISFGKISKTEQKIAWLFI